MDGPVDDVRTPVVGLDAEPERKDARSVDLADPVLDGPDDRPPVGAAEHHNDAADDLVRSVLDRAALADGLSGLDSGHVSQEHGYAPLRLQGHGADVRDVLEQADPPDEKLPFVALQDVASDVDVVPTEHVADVSQGQVISEELFRVYCDLVLLDVSAEGVDVVNAWYGLEQGGQDPVLNGPDLGQVFRPAHPGRQVPEEGVLIDLAHGRRNGPHGDLRARGDALPSLDQPLEDELAGKIDIDAVLENDRDHGQARFRDRPDLGEPGQAAHGDFDGKGDEPLDLGRRHARGGGQDFDLNVGNIGKGVDRDAQDGPNAQGDEEENAEDDEKPLAERALNETFNHAHVRPPARRCAARTSRGILPT